MQTGRRWYNDRIVTTEWSMGRRRGAEKEREEEEEDPNLSDERLGLFFRRNELKQYNKC